MLLAIKVGEVGPRYLLTLQLLDYLGPMLSIRVDGAKLRRRRESQGLSVAHLAEEVGVSRWLVYNLEQERCGPSPEVYARLKSALGAADADLEADDGKAATP